MKFENKVKFVIPAYFDNKLIFDPQKTVYGIIHHYLPENAGIEVYGVPGTCTWNGGRPIFQEGHTIQKIESYFISLIYNFGINIQLSMTNALLEERDMYDRYGNALLELAEKYHENVEVLVCSPILEKHIRDNYPKIRVARSITNMIHPTVEDCKKYSTVLIPYDKNGDFEYIKSLANKGAELEMLVDERCRLNCPMRKTHHLNQNTFQLYKGENIELTCLYVRDAPMLERDMLPEYEKLGVTKFKLTERCSPEVTIKNLMNYVVENKEREKDRDIVMWNLFRCFQDKLHWHPQEFYGGKLKELMPLAEAVMYYD